MIGKRIFTGVLNVLFPDNCPVCGNSSGNYEIYPFCDSCWHEIRPYSGPSCGVCGLPLPSTHSITCGECLKSPPDFARLRSYGLYEGGLKEAIHQLKFRNGRHLARPLARLLVESGLPENLPEAGVVIPVPLHHSRLFEREYNQSALLAREIAELAGMRLELNGLGKSRKTIPQVGLSRKLRLANLRGAFGITDGHRFDGCHVLLVDDVCTTGATLRECARVLAKAGAENVNAVTLARSTQDVWGVDDGADASGVND
ncbi:MAG: ComF family protein [Nitrospirae bacterium]|nr:ComF family protein [Nitrospirota bacterium]